MFSFKKSHKAVFPLWREDNCFFKWCIKLCALDSQTLDCKMPQYERLMGLDLESGQIHCFHKPSWDTRSSGKRWAAFPTLFNSLSKAPDFVPMYSLLNLILVYLNKWHIGNWIPMLIQVLTFKLWLWGDGLCKHPTWLGNLGLNQISFQLSLFPPFLQC